jgi:hypothetical protein
LKEEAVKSPILQTETKVETENKSLKDENKREKKNNIK